MSPSASEGEDCSGFALAPSAGGARLLREIPFNYTSADDRQTVTELLGGEVWESLEQLRTRRVTGRSARLLLRVFGELLIHRRNAYLFEELVGSARRRRRFLSHIDTDLSIIERNSRGEALVVSILERCRGLLEAFRREVDGTPALRRRLVRELAPIVGADGVRFDPFTRVAHATDATDWRLHLPVAVAFPRAEEEVAPLLAALGRLGLSVVPRGGGTGLTGGAVPLRPGCVVVNTERLDRIRGAQELEFPAADGGRGARASVLELEAGVVTERAMEWAAQRGLVFATDPTSAWASTIGGNVAENAGGKGCVQWGTCIDNLAYWRMALPGGHRVTVRRAAHPLRKILPGDEVVFTVEDEAGAVVRTVKLAGDQIRRPGLWKDITNKALGGLPGLQKEGTDGIVTSAAFVLHRAFARRRTLCLEFFGPDFDEASQVILALSRAFPFGRDGAGALTALEHFDDAYVRAIDYQVKAARPETPRAVLLVDLSGHDDAQVARGAERLREVLRAHPNTALFEARDEAEAKRFWADRKRLGAIARRTNAFKMNEDVVLPLESLAAFARWIDAANVEEERFAQLRFVERAEELLRAGSERTRPQGGRTDEAGWLANRLPSALERCARARGELAAAGAAELRALSVLGELRADLAGLLRGAPALVAALDRADREVRDRLVVLATHMHAGDGNVHVNVPVLSNDLPMLRRVEQVIDRVMAEVVRLGGVVSGEHGIGITKLKYLDRERIAALDAHRRELDPEGVMNPGKLQDLDVLDRVFTPSFNLLELEARILQHGQLERLAKAIAHCVRCGKCKGDCCVNHPARGMFFHPRNKNLAIGALVEALLYDAQRERTTGFELLRWLEEVADHCTICHKCLAPCPVAIDTGAVSVLERELLTGFGMKRTPAATRATLRYLDTRSPAANRVLRAGLVRLGGAAQRAVAAAVRPLQPRDPRRAPYPLQLLRAPLPPVPARTLRDVLPACGPEQALLLEPPGEARRSAFYFPGCGSERLHGAVGMAALHLLLRTGTRVVMPPPFLCCGFPAHANAKVGVHDRTVLRDTIVFSQIRDMFAYLSFDACAVSCGTCREALLAMGADELFGGRVVDAARLALEGGLRVPGGGDEVLYHAPCHDSLEGGAVELLARAGGAGTVAPLPHCCSEAGTLALSRPDIADALLDRKRAALREALGARRSAPVLTNCPSCLQGLGRLAREGARPKHLAVHLAERLDGPGWQDSLRQLVKGAQVIQF